MAQSKSKPAPSAPRATKNITSTGERPATLAIWDQVCVTNPADTKKIDSGEFSGTAVKQMARMREATKLFGPLGINWGYEILNERFDKGVPLFTEEGVVDCFELIHTMLIKLWYKYDGQRGEIVHFGHTPYRYMANEGEAYTDRDYGKKTLTDAIGKCLSTLGFNADIYEGEFDDKDYVDAAKDKFAVEKADDQVAEQARQKKEYIDQLEKHIELISTATSKHEAERIYKTFAVKVNRMGDDVGLKRLGLAATKACKRFDSADSVKDRDTAPPKKKAPIKKKSATRRQK